MRSAYHIVNHDLDNGIVFLEDLDILGTSSITNDAENVIDKCRRLYGDRVRIVYKGTDNEWWEIVTNHKTWMGTGIGFKPWHGLVWDKLSRTEA